MYNQSLYGAQQALQNQALGNIGYGLGSIGQLKGGFINGYPNVQVYQSVDFYGNTTIFYVSQPIVPYTKIKKRMIEKLRSEIKNWHGNPLGRNN